MMITTFPKHLLTTIVVSCSAIAIGNSATLAYALEIFQSQLEQLLQDRWSRVVEEAQNRLEEDFA